MPPGRGKSGAEALNPDKGMVAIEGLTQWKHTRPWVKKTGKAEARFAEGALICSEPHEMLQPEVVASILNF